MVPEGALSRTDTCPVVVKALISGRFQFPKGFQSISALYAVSSGRRFNKNVRIMLQHCFLIERNDQLKRFSIIKAPPTKPGNPYVFETVKGGCFKANSQYCEVWLSEFCIIGAATDDDDDDDNSCIGNIEENSESDIISSTDLTVHDVQNNEKEETENHTEYPTASINLANPFTDHEASKIQTRSAEEDGECLLTNPIVREPQQTISEYKEGK